MKCYLVDGRGLEGIRLADRPAPEITRADDVLVDVKACSLNFRDLMVAKGLYQYQAKDAHLPPIIALSDMMGVVRAVGDGVTDLKPGDRVLNAPFRHYPAGKMRSSWARTFVGGNGVDGVLAEQIVYPADALVKVPAHLSNEEASTFTIAGLTAWAAVITHGKVRPGEWVLLQGTGGVSLFAAQLAHAAGARIVMTTSSKEKAELVKQRYGVTATVDYHAADWQDQAKALTGGCGFDVVVDVVGGESLGRSLQVCTYGARVAVIGVLSGSEATLNVRDLLRHQIQIRGTFMESTQELRALMNAVDAAKLKPAVDQVFPFAQAVDAYRHLEAQRHVGKVVISL